MIQALELLKGTSWEEATLKREEIKAVAIAIIKLRLSEALVRQSVGRPAMQSGSPASQSYCINFS